MAGSDDKPPVFNYVLSFILVGLAWGLTTPFIRRAARSHNPPPHALLDDPVVKQSWLRSKVYGAFFAVVDLLRNPRYAVPLVLNLTGSVWFFLLIGQAGKRFSSSPPSYRMLSSFVAGPDAPCQSGCIIGDSSPHVLLSSVSGGGLSCFGLPFMANDIPPRLLGCL
jgi:hypothetical protein